MVVTTQSGKTFLAGGKTSCGIVVASDERDKPAKHKIEPVSGIAHRMFAEYYKRTDEPARELISGGMVYGRYKNFERAKEIQQDFYQAMRSGAPEFIFPET